MNPVLDSITWLLFLLVLIALYIVAPFMAAYYLHKRLWISDRMRIFFSVSLFIASLGVLALVISKLMA
jgi:hypothetical protein